ncbi:MAG: hypothetical protein Q9165_007245 [Trypethelium subeluteriae]
MSMAKSYVKVSQVNPVGRMKQSFPLRAQHIAEELRKSCYMQRRIQTLTHFKRGGAGNEHVEKFGGHSKDPNRETLGDKVKHLFHKEGHHDEKKREESPLHQETRAE